MKLNCCLFVALFAGIFAATAQPTTFNVTLVATYQNPSVKQPTADSGDITATGTSSVKITSATLQSLIASNLGTSLAGSTLAWDQGGGTLGETNSKTGTFEDVSTLLTINTDASGTGEFITSGTSDSIDPIAQSQATTSEWVVTFDDGAGNAFTVSGLIKWTASLAAQGKTQSGQTESISFSGAVTGFGTVVDKSGNTDNAVFSGTITGSGRGPQGS